ncbi:hypothetical protein [Escherichia coli]|nr:hypothetical protein [Escherichia coli]
MFSKLAQSSIKGMF